jgi:hypothetical protein
VWKSYVGCSPLGLCITTDYLPGVDLARRMHEGMVAVVVMHYAIIVRDGVVMDHDTDHK